MEDKKSYTVEEYLRIDLEDKDISLMVSRIFDKSKVVPLKEFQATLVDRFNFNPTTIVSKEKLDKISGLVSHIENEVCYYPIRHEKVYKSGSRSPR